MGRMNADRTVVGATCECRLVWDTPGTGAASVRGGLERGQTRMGRMNADGTVVGEACERRLAWDAPGTGAASVRGKGIGVDVSHELVFRPRCAIIAPTWTHSCPSSW